MDEQHFKHIVSRLHKDMNCKEVRVLKEVEKLKSHLLKEINELEKRVIVLERRVIDYDE